MSDPYENWSTEAAINERSKPELPSPDAIEKMLATLRRIRESRIDRPTLHSIRVTKSRIPGGWTYMYRSDGHAVVYVNSVFWAAVPKQQYSGLTLLEIYGRGDVLTAIPVYEEK